MEFMGLNIGIRHSMKWKEMPISAEAVVIGMSVHPAPRVHTYMHFKQREFVTRK